MVGVKDVVVRVDQFQAVALELRDDGLLAGSGAPYPPPMRRMKPLRWARIVRPNVNPAPANQVGREVLVYRNLKLRNSYINPYPPKLCSTESKSSHVERRGIDVFGQSGWKSCAIPDCCARIQESVACGRDSQFRSTDPIPSAARTASHIRRAPGDKLVPRRGGCTKTVARSVHLHGPRQTRVRTH